MFSPDSPVSSTNKTDRHDIAEILLKVALNTIAITLFINWQMYIEWIIKQLFTSSTMNQGFLSKKNSNKYRKELLTLLKSREYYNTESAKH